MPAYRVLFPVKLADAIQRDGEVNLSAAAAARLLQLGVIAPTTEGGGTEPTVDSKAGGAQDAPAGGRGRKAAK